MRECWKIRWATTEESGARRKIVLVRKEKKEQRERYGVRSTAPGALQAQEDSTSALKKLMIQSPKEATG